MESPWGHCVKDIRYSMNFCDWDVSLGAKDSNKLHLALTQYVFSVNIVKLIESGTRIRCCNSIMLRV
jgi:hypothetical protein